MRLLRPSRHRWFLKFFFVFVIDYYPRAVIVHFVERLDGLPPVHLQLFTWAVVVDSVAEGRTAGRECMQRKQCRETKAPSWVVRFHPHSKRAPVLPAFQSQVGPKVAEFVFQLLRPAPSAGAGQLPTHSFSRLPYSGSSPCTPTFTIAMASTRFAPQLHPSPLRPI